MSNRELNCIGCGQRGCDGKAGCDWYDSAHKEEALEEAFADEAAGLPDPD